MRLFRYPVWAWRKALYWVWRNSMKSRIAVAATMFALMFGSGAIGADPPRKQLFNGKDLSGWTHVSKGSFTVEDGALKTEGGMGLLWYTGERFGDAVIRVVYKGSDSNTNSGVFIRIPEEPHDAWFPVHRGYEVQINDGADEFHRTGAIYSMSSAEKFPPSRSGWNTMEIKLEGQTTVISVNGKVVNTFEGSQPVPERKKYYEPRRGPRPDSGYVGVQNHDEESVVWFKEISVTSLSE